MKLMICGKGGSGKSTVTALLARQYAAQGKRVVVLDTDVSNTGLHRILGTDAPPDLTGHFSGQRLMREAMRNAGQNGMPRGDPATGRRASDPIPPDAIGHFSGDRPMREATRDAPRNRMPRATPPPCRWTFDTIPLDYISRSGNLALVSVGKIRDARQFGKGRWTGLARRVLTGLELSANDRVVIDSDAGVEHLSRKLGEACDGIIAVIDPTYESVRIATTISRMAGQADVPFFIVLNKTNAGSSRALRDALPDPSRIIADFGLDQCIQNAGFTGSPLPAGNPAAVSVIEKVEGMRKTKSPASM
jgi:CO dehydrogenase maturation factor